MVDQRIRLDEIVDGQSITVDPVTGKLKSTPINSVATGIGILDPLRFFARKATGATPQAGISSTDALDILDADDVRARNVLRGQRTNLLAHRSAGTDQQMFVAAVAATPSGGVLDVPSGTYTLTDEVVFSLSITVEGHGISTIINAAAGKAAFAFAPPSGSRMVARRLQINNGAIGIEWRNFTADTNSSMETIQFGSQTDAAIKLTGAGATLLGTSHKDLFFYFTNHGIYAGDVPDTLGNTTWTNLNFVGTAAGGYGIRCFQPGSAFTPNIVLINPIFQAMRGSCVYIRSCTMVLIAPHIETNGVGGNGTSAVYPDFVLESGTSPCRLITVGGQFGASSAVQNNKRVLFAGGACQFVSQGTHWTAGSVDIIDGSAAAGATGVSIDGFSDPPTLLGGFTLAGRNFGTVYLTEINWAVGGPKDLVGVNTPEGAIAAVVGSTFRRLNGGAGTSFYVKESGAGNTGWVAK